MGIIDQELTTDYALYNGDTMEVLPTLKDESVGMSIYSPPFPELYQYSSDPRDMSNCKNYREGMDQFRFVIQQIHRLTMPGRLTCVHCIDLKKGGEFHEDFSGDIIKLHEEAGWNFACRIVIWKDPWAVARRTRVRSLMHKLIVNDSSKCQVCGPDYVVVFKKSGINPSPITHPDGLRTYAGEEKIPEHLSHDFADFHGDQRKNLLSHWIWRRYASPVWMDIRNGNVMKYKEARETDEEKHVCPLQLDVIERCLTLWSNPGDVVLTPFLGVGSEVYQAVKMSRRGIGIELKPTYYRQAKENIAHAKDTQAQVALELSFSSESVGFENDPGVDETDTEMETQIEEPEEEALP